MSLEDRRNNAKAAFEAARARLQDKRDDKERGEPVPTKQPLPPRMVLQPKTLNQSREREANEAQNARDRAGEKRQSILDEIGKKQAGLTQQRAKGDFDRSR